MKADVAAEAALQRLTAKHRDIPRENLRFVAFIGRYERATLVFDTTGALLGALPDVEIVESGKPRKDLHSTAG